MFVIAGPMEMVLIPDLGQTPLENISEAAEAYLGPLEYSHRTI